MERRSKSLTFLNRQAVLLALIVLGIASLAAFCNVPVAKAVVYIEGHITSDTTWLPVDTYRVINNTYVDFGVTLTILPGVHVQVDDTFSLIIQGSLNATGTDADPIVFTSSRVLPIAGAWNTIDFIGALNCSFVLEHARVWYAVNGITVESQEPATIARSVVSNCSQSGIMIKGKSNIAIVENTIELNTNGIATDPSTEGTQGGIVIAGNIISFNTQNGISFGTYYSSSPIYNVSFSFNTVSFNGLNGIYIGAPSPLPSAHLDLSPIYNMSFSSNIVSSNGLNGICIYSYSWYASFVYGISFSSNTVSSNKGNGIYLYSYSDPIFSVTFSSNIVSSNNGNGIYFYTDLSSIYSVSFSSNTVSSNNGNGICLYSSGFYGPYIYGVSFSSNTISYNMGNGIYVYIFHCPIYGVSFSSNTILSSGLNGIYVFGGHQSSVAFDVAATKNIVATNHQRGIYFHDTSGFGDIGVRSNLTENSILYNYQYGISYQYTTGNLASRNDIYSNGYGMTVSSATVNATNNYWGEPTGPYQLSVNPEGKGNQVNGNGVDLDFIPFLTSPEGQIRYRPVAVLSVDKDIPGINETVTFSGINSTSGGTVDYYLFDFGDGTSSGWTTLPTVVHKYFSAGSYLAALTVKDDYGIIGTTTLPIQVGVVVPEFPQSLILPLFIVLTLMGVAVARRKRNL